MTDDLTTLRGAMAELAEHGGSPDLYERALHTSRRRRHRDAFVTVGGAAVGVTVAVVTGLVLSGGGDVGDPVPVPVAPAPVTPSTGVTPTGPPSPAATRSPADSSPSTRPTTPRPVTPTTPRRAERGCPVTAATLNRAPGLPDGYRITPDTVECWQDWATGWDRDQQGDGMYLFRHSAGRGWRVHAQGSSFDCADLGIRRDPDDPPPFCA